VLKKTKDIRPAIIFSSCDTGESQATPIAGETVLRSGVGQQLLQRRATPVVKRQQWPTRIPHIDASALAAGLHGGGPAAGHNDLRQRLEFIENGLRSLQFACRCGVIQVDARLRC
jgi:hypothetical protein